MPGIRWRASVPVHMLFGTMLTFIRHSRAILLLAFIFFGITACGGGGGSGGGSGGARTGAAT